MKHMNSFQIIFGIWPSVTYTVLAFFCKLHNVNMIQVLVLNTNDHL